MDKGFQNTFREENAIYRFLRDYPAQIQPVFRILAERQRQTLKWGEQNHDMFVWLSILHEETGELAEACLHKKFGGPKAGDVQLEADHVAAVGLQIVEYLIRQDCVLGSQNIEPGPVNPTPRVAVEPKEEFLKRALKTSRVSIRELTEQLEKVSARRDKWKDKASELEAREDKRQRRKEDALNEIFDCINELQKYRKGKYVLLPTLEPGWLQFKAERLSRAVLKLVLL